jgi:hypothetical protein
MAAMKGHTMQQITAILGILLTTACTTVKQSDTSQLIKPVVIGPNTLVELDHSCAKKIIIEAKAKKFIFSCID